MRRVEEEQAMAAAAEEARAAEEVAAVAREIQALAERVRPGQASVFRPN